MKTNPNMIRTLRTSNFYPTLFTNVGLDLDDERALVGRARRPAEEHAGLAGQALEPAREGRKPPIRIRGSRSRSTTARPFPSNSTIPKGVPDLGHPPRRAAVARRSRSSPRPSTGRTACSWAPGRARKRPPPRPARSACCAATLRHAPLLRLQHGRLFPPLDQHGRLHHQAAQDLSRSTGSAWTRTASSSGRDSATTCAS